MSVTKEEFVAHLVVMCPETQPIIDKRVPRTSTAKSFFICSSPTCVVPAIAAFEDGDNSVRRRCLDAVGAGMWSSNDYVQNTIGVSFVEDTPWYDPTMQPYIDTWPKPLRDEVAQRRGG